MTNRPGASSAERFAGFGAVGNGRVEGENAKRFFRLTFVTHIGFCEVAEAAEGFLVDTGRQELVPAIEIPDFGRLGAIKAIKHAFTHEAVRFAGAERPTKAQAEVVVDFLEDHAGAVDVFVKMTIEAIDASACLPRFPQRPAFADADQKNRQGATGVGMAQDLSTV